MIDWEGLKAFNADFKAFRGQNTALAIAESLPAILAQHEADQKVIAAAKKGIAALKPLLSYDSYETEYDGQTIEICPSCGKQDGKHSDSCEFVLAKAALAEFDKVVKP